MENIVYTPLDARHYVPITEHLQKDIKALNEALVDLELSGQERESYVMQELQTHHMDSAAVNERIYTHREAQVLREKELRSQLAPMDVLLTALNNYDTQIKTIERQLSAIEREYQSDCFGLFDHLICGESVTELYNELSRLDQLRAALVIEFRRNKRVDEKQAMPISVVSSLYANDSHFANHGFNIVMQGDRYGVVDKDGNVAIPFEYDYLGVNIKNRPLLGEVKDGYLIASKNNKIGIIDINGKVVLPCRYSQEDVLSLHYPSVCFNLYPKHKTDNERFIDLKYLDQLCADPNKHYNKSDDIEVFRRGETAHNTFKEHILSIDHRDYGEALKICTKYKIVMPRIEPLWFRQWRGAIFQDQEAICRYLQQGK